MSLKRNLTTCTCTNKLVFSILSFFTHGVHNRAIIGTGPRGLSCWGTLGTDFQESHKVVLCLLAAGRTTDDIIVLGKFEQKMWNKEELLKIAVCIVQLHHSYVWWCAIWFGDSWCRNLTLISGVYNDDLVLTSHNFTTVDKNGCHL